MNAQGPIRDRIPSLPPEWKGTARYEVIGCLGHGGMGVVYEAFDRERRQQVAVKTLLNFDAAGLYLFKQEFRTLADVQHANLVHLYELVVPEDGQVFFTMELVRGKDFRQYAERPEGRRPSHPPESVVVNLRAASERETYRPRLGSAPNDGAAPQKRTPADVDLLRSALRQLVEGIEVLHCAGKMHRDIKPSNVLVTPEGRVVILDFGVATELRKHAEEKNVDDSEMVGTANYMAPEQAMDAAPTPASDWYSVGVVLYEALVGRPPFAGSTIDVLTLKNTIDPPPPSACVEGVPDDLEALCMALLQRDPARRPGAAEILIRLGAHQGTVPTAAPSPGEVPAAFIGRDAQLQVLRNAFAAANEGRATTVRVAGASGMGKSTLVHRFLDEIASEKKAVVLRGRAYERESVPYKVVDSVVDALSRHLIRCAEAGNPIAPPEGAWALGRLFPVLQRVEGFEPPVADILPDPQAIRRMAFSALRALLESLGKRQPVVIFADDVHWGDVDSANLLLEVLRPPKAPPLLLLMTFREAEAKTSPFVKEMESRWPAAAVTEDVLVGPLGVDDARRLALLLLEADDEMTQRTARAVARESRGSPFLIEELVRSNRGVASSSGATLAILTLEQLVSERLDRLPEQARRLIEIVAVSGRPLPVSVVASASGVEGGVHELVSLLSARRFARTGMRDGRDVVEMTHDRIRETVVALAPDATVRDHHRRLARVLEEVPGADAEAIAVHWLGAGDSPRAGRFAEDAAAQAEGKLAFEQAARLYKVAIDSAAGAVETRRLLPRYAAVLQHAGRYEEAAQAFVAAVEGADADRRVEYRLAAAQQMINAGRPQAGDEMLRDVLATVGMTAPRSAMGAVFWLVVYRVWFAMLRLRFVEREPSQVSREDRLRIDALYTVAMGFSIINVILSACMQMRHLIEAFRHGDRFQVLRAAGLAYGHLASTGKHETKQELALAAIASRLHDRDGSPQATSHYAGALGVGLFQRGRWLQASEQLERVYKLTFYGNAGFANIRLFAIYVGFHLGQLEETLRRITSVLADAEDRKDRYTIVNLKTSSYIHVSLMADDPQRAREGLKAALANWESSSFGVQQWQAMVYAPEIDVYEGKLEGVYERFLAGLPELKRSFLLHSGFIRAYTHYAHGRLAIASIDVAPEKRDERVAVAMRCAAAIDKEYEAWTRVLAASLRASAENAAGHHEAAITQLRLALEHIEATNTVSHREPARYRLGQLLGGDEGDRILSDTREKMTAMGIRAPALWPRTLFPGKSWPANRT